MNINQYLALLFCWLFMLNAKADDANSCQLEQQHVFAQYDINDVTKQGNKTLQQLNLYRLDNQVIHQYEHNNIGLWWTKTSHNRLMLNRFFDHEKRVIEYQADEITGSFDWHTKYQLINEEFLTKMKLVKSTGEACNTEQVLTYQSAEATYQLVWLPNLKLIKSLKVSQAEQIISQWSLVKYSLASDKAKEKFTQLLDYKSTDYADIGDNENDTFLSSMINQGFVEHQHAGLNHNQGDDISSNHSH